MAYTTTPYATSEEVREVLERFESCKFAKDEFHHREHLTVVMCFILEATEEEAMARMRAGLLRFLEHHATLNAYHETITRFWIKRVGLFLDEADKTRPRLALANDLIEVCGNARLIDTYFSAERLASEEARRKWADPDLQPIGS